MLAYRTLKAVAGGEQSLDKMCTLGNEVLFESLGGTTPRANSTVRGEVGKEQQYLQPGEKMTVEALLCGMMAVSGNDAANGLAVQLDGSEEAYLSAVNRQMHEAPFELSESTVYARAYGRECYASAEDVAKMLYVILCDRDVSDAFWQVASVRNTRDKVKIVRTNGEIEEVDRENTHRFITGRYRGYLERELGGGVRVCGKTGTWIKDFVQVTAVEREGRILIAVVLKGRNERERDDTTLSLLSWGFHHDE